MRKYAFILIGLFLLWIALFPATSTAAPENVALKAMSSTSYVSSWESLAAINDGFDPSDSNDRSHAVYGNWPETGTQWVQYEWSEPVTTDEIAVYWFDDPAGIDCPSSSELKYWNGSSWITVSTVGVSPNQYNTATFTSVTTTQLRLEFTSNGSQSTGILEFQVMGTGGETGLEAPLEPVITRNYKLNSAFFNQRIKKAITSWIPYVYDRLSDLNCQEGGINNIIQAGRKLDGLSANNHLGYWFSNAYVLNSLESMCIALMVDPQGDQEIADAQNAMRAKINEWVPLILNAQEADGYFQTWRTLGDYERWTNVEAHEGYVAGYFLEAAIAHHVMTNGTDNSMYDAAKRLADCWYDNIGPAPKKSWYDGHQEMELALTRFARYVDEIEGEGTGNKYVELSKFLLDSRYGGSEYDQSHAYPADQTRAVGHAVRAVYMYTGMADVASLADNVTYHTAIQRLWDNLVNTQMYITGGLGSGETSEGFGPEYSLPNHSYCESCAGAGMIFLQHRMNLAYKKAQYADLLETALYNNLLSGLSLQGTRYRYTNPLDSSEGFIDWHICPCCVGNIPRTLLSLPTWMYSKSNDAIYINLFVGSTVTLSDISDTDVQIIQRTDYPLGGDIDITINPEVAKDFTIKIRVPDRSVSHLYSDTPQSNGITSIHLNGHLIQPTINKGYAEITRTWNSGDTIEIVLPIQIQRVKAADQVAADRGKVALQYGPLVFNIESVDNGNQDVGNLILSPDASLTLDSMWMEDHTAPVIRGTFTNGSAMTAVPNYTRLNRGGRSLVWIRDQ